MRLFIILVCAVLLLGGCARNVTKTPVATGGSKADGTVRVGYEVDQMERVTVDWAGAERNALARCQAWGYSRAEAFGGQTNECTNQAWNGFGYVCTHGNVYKDYQCLD